MAIMHITKDNFKQEVILSDTPVLLDFYADWCGPCRMLSPIVEEIAEEYQGKIKVGKINVDEEEFLALSYEVEAVPTLIAIKNGVQVNKGLGLLSKEIILDLFNKEEKPVDPDAPKGWQPGM